MEDGDHDISLARGSGDDGERGVHGGGSTEGDGGELAKPFCKQRGKEEGENLAHDVGKEGNGAELWAAHLGDEDRGERVIAESRANCQTVGQLSVGKQCRCRRCAGKSAYDGHYGQKHQPRIDTLEATENLRIASYAYAYAEHQCAKGVVGEGRVGDEVSELGKSRIRGREKGEDDAEGKECYDDKTAFHALPPFDTCFHNSHAANTLPMEPPMVRMRASRPRV